MDYLDLPGSGEEHMNVPFVATLPLPHDCAFNQFPERCGFRHNNVFRLNLHPAEVADFAQSWLFFGLLSALMGHELDIFQFRTPLNHTGEHNVALGRLRQFIQFARVQYAALQIPQDIHESDRLDLEADLSTLMSTIPSTYPRYSDDPDGEDTRSPGDLEMVSHDSLARLRYDFSREPGRRRMPVHNERVRFSALQAALDGVAALERRYGEVAYRPLERVFLSIRVLISFFELKERAERPILSSDLQNPTVGARVIRDLMRANNWCPSQWHQICRTHGYVNAYLLSCISKRVGPDKDHSGCQDVSCRAWSSGGPSQAPKHRDLYCTCSETGVSTDALCLLIERGQIPLISINIDNRDGPAVSLHAWNGWTPYIAISHIWADGMCNPKANTLPTCQLFYLHRVMQDSLRQGSGKLSNLVERFTGSKKALFWLDTLCIPPQPPASDANAERYKSMKSRAIDSMNTIYANADSTIVFDSAIQTLSASLEPAVLLAHICYNGWMTRAWTLQEGGLPIRLLFAVSGGLFNPFEQAALVRKEIESRALRLTREKVIKRLLRWRRNQPWLSHDRYRDLLRDISWDEGPMFRLHNKLCHSLLDFRQQSHRIRPDDITYGEMILPTWNALIRRDSSFKQDLPYILANLLGFKTSEIRDHPEHRIAKIIGSLDRIPFGFLCNTGPRLGPPAQAARPSGDDIPSHAPNSSPQGMLTRAWNPANRWVPRELDGQLLPPGPLLEPTPSGLKLSASACAGSEGAPGCYVYMIYQPGPSLETFILTRASWNGRQFLVEGSRQAGDDVALPTIEAEAKGYCILLERKGSGTAPQEDETLQDGEILRGALLAIVEEDRKGIVKTMYHSPIRALLLEERCSPQHFAGDGSGIVLVDREGPENLEIAYSPDGIGKIQGRTTEVMFERHAFANRTSKLLTGANLVVAVTIASYNLKDADSKTSRFRIAVSIMALVLEPTIILLPLFFKTWLLRQRILYLFNSSTSLTSGEAARQYLTTSADHIVNSAFARVVLTTLITVALIMTSIYTSGVRISALTIFFGAFVIYAPIKILMNLRQVKGWAKRSRESSRKHWTASG